MSEEDRKEWKNFALKISLGNLLALLISVIVMTWACLTWIDGRFYDLEKRLLKLEYSKSGDITNTNEGNNSTVNVSPGKTEADRILEKNPDTLSTQELAILEGVNADTIRRHILPGEEGGDFYTDRHGRKWQAVKVGSSWRIENPFRQ